ncbi:hypothetical protein HDU76_011845, partial [Blyttiomyces sp. JEL0837]
GVITNFRTGGDGIFFQQTIPDGDLTTSDAITIFTGTANFKMFYPTYQIGDTVSIASAIVNEFRSSSYPYDNSLTQLTNPTGISVVKAKPVNASVTDVIVPRVVGDLDTPLRITYTGREFDASLPQVLLDSLTDAVNISTGVGFWESLEGMLVRVPSPRVISSSDAYNEFFVVGNNGSYTTKTNSRGGVTLALDNDGLFDTHPDRIRILLPYGGQNPLVAMGDTLRDIVGTVDWKFNSWTIIPISAPVVKTSKM